MREMNREILEILDTVVPSKPVFKLTTYYSGLQLRSVFSAEIASTSFLVPWVKNSMVEQLDIKNKCMRLENKHETAANIAQQVRYSMADTIMGFLANYQDSKNNRLTSLYRWYRTFLDTSNLRNNESFENDMFNIFKWIKTNTLKCHKQDQTTKGIISVLEALKQRYEAKGMKV